MMYTIRYPQVELGALIRRRVLIELDTLKAYGCIVTYREHKGLLSTVLVDLRITGPKDILEAWDDYVWEVGG